ncbi:MAG: polysaccharide biosynthesis tyrosine autokinase [Paludibacteraceae bacterium]|nr:polysaccharide biosynthesis tyrosine autokinase [Paludibacteraceae bacterium]
MEQNNVNNEIDLRKIVRVVLERWWWFAIGVGAFVLLGVAYYVRKTPTWTTDASIMLRQREGIGESIEALSMLGLSGNTAAEDEVVVLSSRGLVYQTIDALDLWDASYIKDGIRWKEEFRHPAMTIDYLELTTKAKTRSFTVTVKPTKSGYKVKTKMGRFKRSSTKVADLSSPVQTGVGLLQIHANRVLSTDTIYRISHAPRESVVQKYQKMIKIAQHKKESNIITFSMTSIQPERDKAVLAQLIEQYNLNAVVDKNMLATNTAMFIEERLAIITSELSDAENALSDYKEQNQIADLQAQSRLFLEASSAEQQSLVEIETQISLVDYIDEFLRDDTKRSSLIPANIGLTDASLASAISEYNTILLHRMRIQRTATENNPVIEQMNTQLSTMRQNIIATIGSVRESLRIRQRNLLAQESKYNRQIKNAPDQEREYLRVVRQQQIKEKLYLYLYEKREENALMLSATAMPAKIVDLPQRDLLSKNPNLKKILLMCILLGLMLPAGLLYLDVLFNNRIDDVREFEQRIKVPVLGLLTESSRKSRIVIHEGDTNTSAELFRQLRTNLKYVIPAETKTPVILVTSSINGDGKSYVASNLALSLAIMGKKVALLGLDIRKPRLATYFNLTNKGHLTDYLAEPSVEIDDIIVPSGEHENLDVLPCGTVPPNPAELLQTERLDQLIAELKKRYDYIVLDTAPLALVSDTFTLDRFADLTMFVCRYKYTPMEMIDFINVTAEQERMHNIVCVLNATKKAAGYGYGYGYGYDYGYGYGYGYGQNPKSSKPNY